jgi:hypothetical protein
MDEYVLAFEQSLDDAIELADEYLVRDAIIEAMEAKLAELKQERLDG